MKVSIIIVNYNTTELLCNCIRSIKDKTKGRNYEVIVVDNNSSEEVKEEVSSIDESVRLIPLNENKGFDAACNIGAKISKGNFLLFLNPDTLLLNDAVNIMAKFMERNPKCAVSGGDLYSEEGIPLVSYDVGKRSFLYEIFSILHINTEKYEKGITHTDQPCVVNTIVGADMMIRKDVFNQIGGFPHFFMYYEEPYISYKINKLGYYTYSIPKAKIIHLEHKASGNMEQYDRVTAFYYIDSSLKFAKIYWGWWGKYLLCLIHFGKICIGLSKACLSYNKRKLRYYLNYMKTVIKA